MANHRSWRGERIWRTGVGNPIAFALYYRRRSSKPALSPLRHFGWSAILAGTGGAPLVTDRIPAHRNVRGSMAKLEIILEGDPRLRQKATRVKHVDESLRKIAADMHETMDAAPGVGLAGPQIGLMRRIIAVHV